MLMSSYIGLADVMSGRQPMLVAANVQRQYDRGLAAHVLRSRPGGDPYLTLADVQSRLDDSTVLVSVLLGRHDIQLLTITNSDTGLDFLEFAESRSGLHLTLLLPDYTVQMYGLGPTVAQLRREVREDPLFRPVTRQGQQLLTTLHSGCVPARLAELRAAGKTHLRYWPHGPFHLIPFHLLGTPERVLADDWTVTVLPGLRALVTTPRKAGTGLLSVGCADGGLAYGLASEPSVEEQATAVASVSGTSALVGSAAAPDDVLRRMGSARYVHVAAHGSINEVAPAFHCLYLAGGRLFAHDLMRVDLTGVDIVTLSTCESALGRFDLGDDPRGIPAALFTAGVKTIVGCLWPVHPDPADLFFRTFYERLLSDSDSGRLAAFRAAQIITREHYPAFRDWGAFVLIGQDHD
jgi:CHAT domain-containing protein